jgi:DNA topoisomerase-1
VKLEKGRFWPTELGLVVNDLLVVNFPDILDIEFTAQMEESLDEIEEGRKGWIETLKEFYTPFQKDLDLAKQSMRDIKREMIPTDVVCEQCGSKMVKRCEKGLFLGLLQLPPMPLYERSRGEWREPSGDRSEVRKMWKPHGYQEWKIRKISGLLQLPHLKVTRPWETGVQCPQGCDGKIAERRMQEHLCAAATILAVPTPFGISPFQRNVPSAASHSW